MSKYILYFICLTVVFGLTGCYRMPTDDDYCVVPTTNNPFVTREKPAGPVPQLSY